MKKLAEVRLIKAFYFSEKSYKEAITAWRTKYEQKWPGCHVQVRWNLQGVKILAFKK